MLDTLSGSFRGFATALSAYYSIEAMNAPVSAGMVVTLFVFRTVAIASIAEVF
jgi:hypothetical protein